MNKWSGLGMGNVNSGNQVTMGNYCDILIANGFQEIRVSLPNYNSSLTNTQNSVLTAVAKGLRVIWGVSSNNYGGNGVNTITQENWAAFRQGILDAALWSQNNGVYEFQIGNEESLHNHYHPSFSRVSNLVTVTTRDYAGTICNHTFDGTHQVTISGATPADLNGTFDITVTGANTFTYTANGDDATLASGSAQAYDLSLSQLRNNLKGVATDVQAIFTRGNVSLTETGAVEISAWNTLGKGDIDLLGWNIYRGGTTFNNQWKTDIDNIFANWGANAYLTEFSLSYTSLNSWSTNEEKQAVGIAEMLNYIEDSGLPRAFFFCWVDSDFGVYDGTNYKLLWNNLITNNGRRVFYNV